jgi:hypothetical protein
MTGVTEKPLQPIDQNAVTPSADAQPVSLLEAAKDALWTLGNVHSLLVAKGLSLPTVQDPRPALREAISQAHQTARALDDLLTAAQTVLAGLNERISQAAESGERVPLFAGIADLHDAIARAALAKGGRSDERI